MADKNKKKGSKAPTLLLVVLLLVGGVIAAGYFKPDLPVIGPLVSGFFEKGAAGLNKNGVYTVKIEKVVLDPQEFEQGQTVDVQVIIKRTNAEGDTEEVWDSSDLGDNLREVGEHPLSVTFSETPFEITWQSGDQLTVEVWNYTGIDERLARYQTKGTDKEFGLHGTHTLTLLDGETERNPRVGGTNQVIFDAKHKGPVPAEE